MVYPFFQPRKDNSIFRFPPLGLGYVAAFLKKKGFDVELVDCTFLTMEKAVEKIRKTLSENYKWLGEDFCIDKGLELDRAWSEFLKYNEKHVDK